ncbi:MAG TPA: hypothetical protein DCP92_22225 [Nitrospiraceae bacterium]|nr:hypothetical protein [Nitrospiraceae bacterium]
MKNKMVWKFILPSVAIVSIVTSAVVLVISIYMREQIRGYAHAQISSKIEQVSGGLDVTNTIMLEKVHASMKVLMSQGLAVGTPALGQSTTVGSETVPNLLLGNKPQDNDFGLVDRVKFLMGGTATFFVKRGSDFVRVSTNVMKDDGSRAVGTLLDPKGKAIAALGEGKPFYGQVDILGNPYITGYEPMYDKNNTLVGAWYVGYPVTTFSQLGGTIAATKILDNGFIALVDDRGKVRFHSKHVSLDVVENLLSIAPSSQSDTWEIMTQHFGPWDFQIVAAYPLADINKSITKATVTAVMCGLAFAGFLIASLYFLITTTILRPIKAITTVANRLADGDLTVNIEPSSTSDEASQLIAAIRGMLVNLKKIILQSMESANQVTRAAEQIADANQNFSQRITGQAASIEETSATMEEMSVSIRQTADNAKEATKLVQTTRSLAESGSDVMQVTIKAMDEIKRSSGRIASISTVIEEIAFQTNLLALNAAVEAARAGEHGKGFAVVASEIRNLAQRASQSAKEITGLIEESVEKTGAGVHLAQELSKRLEEMGMSVKKVTDLMDEVAVAASEQSSGINQINTAMSQIDQATQQNASLVEETASATEELAAQAKELTNLIAFFTLEEETTFEKEGARERQPFAAFHTVGKGTLKPLQRGSAKTLSPLHAKMTLNTNPREENSNGGFQEF